ncbi:MAG: nucleotidyltransferase domain-containing protein [Nitrospirae bacterium]|nr:nucleotidyltransferase domain-containing protein [Nitrospirota bacterium]
MKTHYKIKAFLEKKDDIVFAILFGSAAEGRETFMSDLDIGIYTVGDLSLPEIGMLVSELEGLTRRRVDVVVLNELYKKSPSLAFNIVKNGKLLFCKDEDTYTAFKRDTFRFYLDAKYLIEQTDHAMLNRIREGRFGVPGNA